MGILRRMPYRRWSRLGIVAVAGHLGYELAVGAGVPGAPRIGVRPAVAGHALGAAVPTGPPVVSPARVGIVGSPVANGLFASAMSSHYASWPRTT